MMPVTNEFLDSINNYGTAISDAGFGTLVPADAQANVKGLATALIAGQLVTHDVFGIAISACGGNLSGSEFGFLADLLIDPAGGASWSVLINNLLFTSPANARGRYNYFFPIWLKSGTSIGMQQQCSTGTQGMRIGVKLLTKPSRPKTVKAGYTVETYGANGATSGGTAITPGSNAAGAWTPAGTVSGAPWFWQAGLRAASTTLAVGSVFLDVSVGDAAKKRLAAQGIAYVNDTAERCGKNALGEYPPIMQALPGEAVYVRASAAATPDSNNSVCAYGVI